MSHRSKFLALERHDLRWAKPAIRRFDWELWPGACGPLTMPPTGSIDALAYRNERGRQDRLYASCFLRSKRGKQMPGDDSASVGR